MTNGTKKNMGPKVRGGGGGGRANLERVGSRRVGPRRVGSPKFRAFFSFSHSHLHSFFLSLGIFSCLLFSLRVSSRVFFPLSGVFSWNFGGVLVGRDLKRKKDTRRHPEREKKTREDPQREKKRMKMGVGEGKKRAKFWAVRRRGGPAEGRSGGGARGPWEHANFGPTHTADTQQTHTSDKHRADTHSRHTHQTNTQQTHTHTTTHTQTHTHTNTHQHTHQTTHWCRFFCPEFGFLICPNVVFFVPRVGFFVPNVCFFGSVRVFFVPRVFAYFVPFPFFLSRCVFFVPLPIWQVSRPIDYPVVIKALLLLDIQIRMCCSGYVNAFQWSRE